MENPIKILIAEHDPIDLELLQYELQKSGISYTSKVAVNEFDFAEALAHFMPDIILSDYTFPSFDGPKALELREKMAGDTPFIFVSGTIGEERSIELIKNGVTDYCLKGNLVPLNHKMSRALKESAASRQKKLMENRLVLSENRLARAQHVAHIGNWEFNFSTRDFICSDEIFRIYGMVPHDSRITAQSFLSFVHNDDIGNIIKMMRSNAVRSADSSISFRIIQNHGQTRHIYLDSKVERDLQGNVVGIYGIMHDISQQVQLENLLEKERMSKVKEITEAVLAAQENERADIERELHDNVNQILGATKLFLELAKHDRDIRDILLTKASGFVMNAIEEIRIISKKMAIPNKRLVGLFDSIKCLIADLSMTGNLNICFDVTDIDENTLDEKLQLNIYRIVQEQLNNILKHAGASVVSVILTKEENEFVLFITDNGIGYDLTQKTKGVGIRNIMSRAALCHGSTEVNSKPGAGYQLKIKFLVDSLNKQPNLLN